MNLRRELMSNKIILLSLSGLDYLEQSIGILKSLSKNKVLYVTLNRTFLAIEESLMKRNVSGNIIYIDGISETLGLAKDERSGKCHYLSSATALPELLHIIGELIKREKIYLIFDSITNLLVYNRPLEAKKFIVTLINNLRATGLTGIFYALDSDVTSRFINEISLLTDKAFKIKPSTEWTL